MIKCKCGYCGKEIEKHVGHYNRAMKLGLNVYCNHTCMGLNRRTSIDLKNKFPMWSKRQIRKDVQQHFHIKIFK